MSDPDFTPDDLARLASLGISAAEALRQLRLLRRPPVSRRLVRPCTAGDGVVRIDAAEADALIRLHDEAAASGRLVKFVPASGAASRMFRDLLVYREAALKALSSGTGARALDGGREAAAVGEFLRRIHEFAFWDDLKDELIRRGLDPDDARRSEPPAEVLAALLDEAGLGLASRPKGLIPFHRYPSGGRTPFEEHLIEGSALVRDASGVCRAHFTVAPEERRAFESRVAAVRAGLEHELGVRFDVTFSEQKRSTETLSTDLAGRPVRDARGELLLRPGGHGALIENLAELDADFVQIKNIDNIAYDPLRRVGIYWKKVVTGLLVRRTGEAAAAGRPVRVCAVVRNAGEPGGGPFWVEHHDGSVRAQIVESAEVDPNSKPQQAIFAAATHFNPVDMVCSLRDPAGRPYDLKAFVDAEAVIVTRKSWEGRELVACERPGLWNGAMAGWDTVFVEVPVATFTPVKNILDLLRPEHLGD